MINGFILLVVLTGVLADINCPNDKLTPQMRQEFIDMHNKLRSELAHGKTKGKGGVPLAAAKDMLEMSWNCKIEETAQKWSDRCKFEHSPGKFRKGAGENIFEVWASEAALENYAKKSPSWASHAWWNEVKKYNVTLNPENLLTVKVFNWGVGHFTQMAWASTFQMGCGVSVCRSHSTVLVVCEYWTAGNWLGSPMYEKGHACTKDSECSSNKCNVSNGLCIHKGGPEYP